MHLFCCSIWGKSSNPQDKMEQSKLLLIFSILLFLIGCEDRHSIIVSPDRRAKIIKNRIEFFGAHSDFHGLLTELKSGKPLLAVKNNTDRIVRIETPLIHASKKRILEDIENNSTTDPESRAKAIYEFVHNNYTSVFPLYSSTAFNSVSFFYSAYGMGYCDDTSAHTFELAKHFGIKGRIWHLEGHVLPELYFNERWQVVDAASGGVGMPRNDDGSLADMPALVKLAKSNRLNNFNEVIASEENNKIVDPPGIQNDYATDPFVEFLSGESRYYFKSLFSITTDQTFKKRLDTKIDKITDYYSDIGNFIRVIPLSSIKRKNKIIIKDYFPIAAAFIRFPNDIKNSQLPSVYISSGTITGVFEENPKPFDFSNDEFNYFDLNVAVPALERGPGREIILNTSKLSNKSQGDLVLAFSYNTKLFQINEESLQEFIDAGLSKL